MVALGAHWVEPRDYIYMVWSWLEILVNLEFTCIVCLCLLTNPFSQHTGWDLKNTILFWLLVSCVCWTPTRIAWVLSSMWPRGIDWSSTHMLRCTQFTSRDRISSLEGCYLAWDTFLIGNLIPEPKNLVSGPLFPNWSHLGVFVLT